MNDYELHDTNSKQKMNSNWNSYKIIIKNETIIYPIALFPIQIDCIAAAADDAHFHKA